MDGIMAKGSVFESVNKTQGKRGWAPQVAAGSHSRRAPGLCSSALPDTDSARLNLHKTTRVSMSISFIA